MCRRTVAGRVPVFSLASPWGRLMALAHGSGVLIYVFFSFSFFFVCVYCFVFIGLVSHLACLSHHRFDSYTHCMTHSRSLSPLLLSHSVLLSPRYRTLVQRWINVYSKLRHQYNFT